MKLNIITIGKLELEFQNILNKYLKRLNFLCDLNIIEIKEITTLDINSKIKKETELILSKIPKGSKVFLCSLNGIEYDSNSFSSLINEDNISFIIGGSNGVNENYFSNKICFSKFTFPHQLFRVIFVEQLYRAFTIKNGIKYHK